MQTVDSKKQSGPDTDSAESGSKDPEWAALLLNLERHKAYYRSVLAGGAHPPVEQPTRNSIRCSVRALLARLATLLKK